MDKRDDTEKNTLTREGTMGDPVASRTAPVNEGNPSCSGCGGPCQFDTSIPSVQWNAVIRAKGLPEYLCLSCIVKAFVAAGESFTARLSGEPPLLGTLLDVRINSADAQAIDQINGENVLLRWRIRELTEALVKYGAHDMDACGFAVVDGQRTVVDDCTCGLDALLEEFEQPPSTTAVDPSAQPSGTPTPREK
jgi:hypothetical protein